MRRLLLAMLVLSPGFASAEWVAVESPSQAPERATVYVDPDTRHRDGNRVTLWQLTDYRWMQGNYVGTPRFLSATAKKEFDCANQRVRLLAFTEYYRQMATGEARAGQVDPDAWLPVEPGSMNHALWEVACGKE